jgi:hypothetical protein
MDKTERLARVMSVLARQPLSTRELKEKAGLRGKDHVYYLLKTAVSRGQVRYHGKDDQGNCLWSRP